jgi:hypothetical protein
MSNLQGASDLKTTFVVSASCFDESLFICRMGSPEMVRGVYIDLIKQR